MKFFNKLTVVLGAACILFSQALAAQSATTLDVSLTVDNEYTLYISTDAGAFGSLIGADSNWPDAETYTDVALSPGVTNYIHVFAKNVDGSGNPAAFLAELTLSDDLFRFPNGTQSLLTNTTDGWLAGPTAPVAATPVKIGDHGDAPWGEIPPISADADWIWLDAIGPAQTQDVIFTVAIVPVEVDIDLSVVDSPDPVVAGSGTGNLTHTFTIANTSAEDATGVEVDLLTASIPATGVGIDSIKDGADVDVTFPWTIGDLAAGASVTVTITLTVGPDAVDGETVSATLGLTAVDQVDSDDTNDEAVDPTTIEREFDLGLAVVDAPDPVIAGAGSPNLTHTFTLSRSGPSDAAGIEVTLTDSNFPAGVTPIDFDPSVGSMDLDGTTWLVGDWAADQNGIDQTLVVALTVDGSVDTCADCIFAEYTVAAASGTDTDSSNDSAVDPTSVTGTTDLAFTFATSIDPIDAGTPDVTLSCNAGLPLVQTAPVGTTFTVKELREGDICTVTMGDLDGDWVGHVYECSGTGVATESGCEFTIDAEAIASTVNVLAIPAAFEYTANLTWEISPDADPGIEDGAMLMATCENVFVGVHGANGPLTTTTVTVAGDMDTFAAIEALPDPNGSTECFAELMGVGSAVEVTNDCGRETVEVGDGMVDCDITATAFYEGIPTLSQYGMALMALLMLGVGFVGFRRFI